MQLDFASRELTIKLVYYGPALSGKTTNLQALHQAAQGDAKGRLMTLETKDDRTLFFDLLPLRFEDESGLSIRLKVFTVPGQVIHASTRRLVVRGADGVAFIADSRRSQATASAESFVDLSNNLGAQGIQLKHMPLVIQFNKRDLPDVRSEAEISEMARRGREPVCLATATKGQGVVECFLGLLQVTWADLEDRHQLKRKFGFDGESFILRVAEKLGQRAPVQDLLGRSFGESLGERKPAVSEAAP